MGAECLECNAPCINSLNECTGLPQTDSAPMFGCMDGREGVDDPTCTLALREQTCEGRGFGEDECTALSCCQYDAVAEVCSAACVIPEDGDACCVLSEDTSGPTTGPTASGTVPQTTTPTAKPTALASPPEGSGGIAVSREASGVASVSAMGLLLLLLA